MRLALDEWISRQVSKAQEDRDNLDRHIDRLEGEVAHLKPAASGNPSPARGMAMLRRGRAKSDLAKAKNKHRRAGVGRSERRRRVEFTANSAKRPRWPATRYHHEPTSPALGPRRGSYPHQLHQDRCRRVFEHQRFVQMILPDVTPSLDPAQSLACSGPAGKRSTGGGGGNSLTKPEGANGR